MATSTRQRVGIWIIAAAMIVGTLAGFIAMILAPNNQAADQAKAEKEFQEQIAEYCEDQASGKKDLQPLKGYKASAFEESTITEVEKKVLVPGKGEKLSKSDTITANYFGWQSNGEIFDSSRKKGKTTPVDFSLSGVIPGWTEGLTGVRVGSVAELSIPADKAYGDTQDLNCSPTGALKFIVEVKAIKETHDSE